MGKETEYEVSIIRIAYGVAVIKVMAASTESAGNKAIGEAPNLVFSEYDSSYEVSRVAKKKAVAMPSKPTYKELMQAVIDAHTETGELLIGCEVEDDADHSPRALHNRLWELIQKDKKSEGGNV